MFTSAYRRLGRGAGATAPALAALVLGAVACGHSADDGASSDADVIAPPKEIVLQLDPKLPEAVSDRITALIVQTAHTTVKKVGPEVTKFDPGAHVLAIGDVGGARLLIKDTEATAIPAEGFIVRTGDLGTGRLLVARGNDSRDPSHYARPNRGLMYGAYAALEQAGFAFLHPLSPSLPAQFAVPAGSINQVESPHWHVRGLHVHTQHPLELANLLNGWGETGTDDQAGFDKMVPEWDSFLEWMIANRQNRVEWSLLESTSWQDFSTSDTRAQRLATVVSHAHNWGIDAGADAPIALQQQHAFRLVVTQGQQADEIASIKSRIDWLMKANFDYLSTENGTTEFTHADPNRMLAWMNEATRAMNEDHEGRSATIKIHCSTGQTADGFKDPQTGAALNVNFLPHYADQRLGVMPHTVEHYGLDDQAPTYGNSNFEYMRTFLQQEAGTRETVYHPESAYWVSFDIDVPLFLPVYADRRVHDLRLLATDEQQGLMGPAGKKGAKMDGQVVFSSGWEWSYWLNDVVAARAAWNPHMEAGNDQDATRAILSDVFTPWGDAKKPVIDALIGWMNDERDLLINGKHDGQVPSNIVQRNGQAYMQGWETWDDVADLVSNIPGVNAPKTQPDKLGLVDMRTPGHGGPAYSAEIEPLLAAMEKQFGADAAALSKALAAVPTKDIAAELTDAANITTLRATQIHGLYDYVDGYWDSILSSSAQQKRMVRLAAARTALDSASKIVASREQHYRVPVDRIAAWKSGPTTYNYGYLWTVHSLMYWWRDEGKAVDVPRSPCYLNLVNPAEVAMGEGGLSDALQTVHDLFNANSGLGAITECLGAPTSEPQFPQDNLRSRP